MIETLSRWLQTYLGIAPAAQQKLLLSLVIILTLWAFHRVLVNNLVQRIKDLERRYQWQKALGYTFSILGLVLASLLWIEGMQYAATYLGLLSAGLAIALKDPITNFVAWVFILWRKPFEVGDRIEIGPYKGDVIDQRIFLFSLMEIGNWVQADQSTGRIVHIPNGMVFTQGIANYTHSPDYIWNELPILITFESNWEKAKGILQEIAIRQDISQREDVSKDFDAASKKLLLKYNKLTPIVYTSVEKSGVLLTIRYLCHPRQRRGSAQAIWEAILRAFGEEPSIEFAYPTQRFYNRSTEKKPREVP